VIVAHQTDQDKSDAASIPHALSSSGSDHKAIV
jgi:hypothetical protein